jgi:hypothetical protein
MIDGAEHIPDPGSFFAWAFASLAPGGYFLVSSNPLYYSPAGHHLWQYFPPDVDPWAHLRPDFLARCEELQVSDWAMQRYQELNRATYSDLRTAFLTAGFTIVAEGPTSPSNGHERLLSRFLSTLNPGIPLSALVQDAFQVCGRKP